MDLVVSPAVRRKLELRHRVTIEEVGQCFDNCAGRFLRDRRERHTTTPPTLWFIAPTDKGRLLKVIFIRSSPRTILKSAFEPAEIEKMIYARRGLK